MLYLPPTPPPSYALAPLAQRLGQAQNFDDLACIFRLQEKSDTMSRFPDSLPSAIRSVRTARHTSRGSAASQSVTYKQKRGYYAIHYTNANIDPTGAEFVMADDRGGAIAVFKGEPPSRRTTSRDRAASSQRQTDEGQTDEGQTDEGQTERMTDEQVTPVYAAQNSGVAVPTGQIFVRFAEGVDARDRSAEIQSAGYVTVKVLDFAPQGAWVSARSGSIADSLQQLQSLEGLEQLEQIEPQMLMQRSLR